MPHENMSSYMRVQLCNLSCSTVPISTPIHVIHHLSNINKYITLLIFCVAHWSRVVKTILKPWDGGGNSITPHSLQSLPCLNMKAGIVCACVKMSICICTYIHMYRHLYMCTHTCMYTSACSSICMHMCVSIRFSNFYMYICIYIYVCVCVYVCIYVCICIYIYIYIYIYIFICMYIQRGLRHTCLLSSSQSTTPKLNTSARSLKVSPRKT